MIFEHVQSNLSPSEQSERFIRSVETQWGCRITIHDELGRCSVEDQSYLPRDRHMHSHRFCSWKRYTRAGWHSACNDHCLYEMKKTILHGGGSHSCWKGGREVVCPIFEDGTLVLTLFAGVFRGQPPMELDREPIWEAAWKALPEIDAEQVETLYLQLEMLGHSLFALSESVQSDMQTRRGQFEHYIKAHFQKDITLPDLARSLGMSEGHCSREFKKHLGLPFRSYLQEYRLKRAGVLLQHSDLTVTEIAERVGFRDPYHFNKSFRAMYGKPPGQWKKTYVD